MGIPASRGRVRLGRHSQAHRAQIVANGCVTNSGQPYLGVSLAALDERAAFPMPTACGAPRPAPRRRRAVGGDRQPRPQRPGRSGRLRRATSSPAWTAARSTTRMTSSRAWSCTAPEDQMQLGITRNGQEQQVTVTVGEPPPPPDDLSGTTRAQRPGTSLCLCGLNTAWPGGATHPGRSGDCSTSTASSWPSSCSSRRPHPVAHPRDFLMILVGVRIAQGELRPLEALAVLQSATMLGGTVLYWVAAWGGHPVVQRIGPYVGVTPERLHRASDSFLRRYGVRAVIAGRFIPWMSTLTTVACVLDFPFRRFVVARSGGLLRLLTFVAIGYFVGPPALRIAGSLHLPLELLASLAALLALTFWWCGAARRAHADPRCVRRFWSVFAPGLVAGLLGSLVSMLLANVLIHLAGPSSRTRSRPRRCAASGLLGRHPNRVLLLAMTPPSSSCPPLGQALRSRRADAPASVPGLGECSSPPCHSHSRCWWPCRSSAPGRWAWARCRPIHPRRGGPLSHLRPDDGRDVPHPHPSRAERSDAVVAPASPEVSRGLSEN